MDKINNELKISISYYIKQTHVIYALILCRSERTCKLLSKYSFVSVSSENITYILIIENGKPSSH